MGTHPMSRLHSVRWGIIPSLLSFEGFLPAIALSVLVSTTYLSSTLLFPSPTAPPTSSFNQMPSPRILLEGNWNLESISSGISTRAHAADARAPPRTLVLYVYHESSEWYKENLRFFLHEAMLPEHDSETVDYMLVINGETELPLDELLDALPAYHQGRVRLLRRPNTCYDGGTIGEVLRADPRLTSAYHFFVLMNSSVRGLFLPRYFSATIGGPWTVVFTGLLSNDVKLVGTTLSCERQAHVQSMVLATDGVGLALLQEHGVLECPTTMMGAIQEYEVQASAVILDAGYVKHEGRIITIMA